MLVEGPNHFNCPVDEMRTARRFAAEARLIYDFEETADHPPVLQAVSILRETLPLPEEDEDLRIEPEQSLNED